MMIFNKVTTVPGRLTDEDNEIIENNPLSQFLESLNDQEKSTNIIHLNESKIAQYVKAVALFQMQAVEDLSSCALKGMILFAARLYRYDLKEMTIVATFDGTKSQVKNENFIFKIKENLTKIKALKPLKMESMTIHREKNNSFLNQPQEVYNLFKTIADLLQDKSGRDALICTASLLVYFEYLSQRSLLQNDLNLDGLILGEEEIDKFYDIACSREEVEYELEFAQ